jgi:hypothetical protein
MALVLMLLMYPFLGTHRVIDWVFNLVFLGVVAAALRVVHQSNFAHYVTWALGLAAVVAGFVGRTLAIDSVYPFGAGIRALFLSYLIVLIFKDIMRRKNITQDAVMGASCVLVLLGLAFGAAYAMIEWLVPGSFRLPAEPDAIVSVFGHATVEFQLAYFSLVTLTTIGFGDIVPVAPPARALAALEGLLSQLYLAIIIARLVGMEIASRLTNRS